MDPEACLQRFAEAGTTAEAREAAADYNGWTARGGFCAKVDGAPVLSLYVGSRGARYATLATAPFRVRIGGAR